MTTGREVGWRVGMIVVQALLGWCKAGVGTKGLVNGPSEGGECRLVLGQGCACIAQQLQPI